MLQNAILNLALNARDAMPEGGTVTFETEILEPGHGPEWPADLLPGRYLCLRVRDTGMGMSREILERIFEPFFTTKAPGKGTGLGLAAVYGTVNQHQGGLTVSSEPEKGSCFSLFLPLSTKPDEIRTSAAAPERTFKRGRILVVEDEELVRDLTKTLLEELGHTVVLMADGVSGTKHYREHWRSIDLVVLDLIMANMDGRSALEDMRRVNPDVRALLISGFTADVDGLVLPEDDRVGFLQKPFERAALAQIVARMMAGG
jgi:CheY-like chemotaxis protein